MKNIILVMILGTCLSHAAFGQENKFRQVMRQVTMVSSNDYQVVSDILDEAIKYDDRIIIHAGLEQRFVPLKLKAVQAIKQIKDEAFIPSLIKAFNDNRALLRGSELQTEQRQLDKNIISALESITGLYLAPEEATPEEMQSAVEMSRKWWDARHVQTETEN